MRLSEAVLERQPQAASGDPEAQEWSEPRYKEQGLRCADPHIVSAQEPQIAQPTQAEEPAPPVCCQSYFQERTPPKLGKQHGFPTL